MGERYETEPMRCKLYRVDGDGNRHFVMDYSLRFSEQEVYALLDAANRGGWVSCRERLPEEETRVLVAGQDYEGDMCTSDVPAFIRDGKWCWGDTGDLVEDFLITDWQPLPAPPKDETK